MSWVICQDFGIDAHMIDGEWLVFHKGSGDTHRLSLEAGFLFGLLWNNKMPMTEQALIAETKQSGFDRLDTQALNDTLKGLRDLSLIKIS